MQNISDRFAMRNYSNSTELQYRMGEYQVRYCISAESKSQ